MIKVGTVKARMPPGRKSVWSARAMSAVPFQFLTEGGQLTFLSTPMMFGTPVDITLSELVLEFFFPANAATAVAMHCFSGGRD
jgi:hypothetical protein